jgi:hypothetical protein
MNNDYSDIINLPHHQSSKHPHMPVKDRAAIFSPFAALTGYDAAVKETARLTDRQMELDEDEKTALDEMIRALVERIDQHPEATITYFQPDARKDGGAYVTVRDQLKKVDDYERVLVLVGGARIPIDTIVDICV